MAEQRSGGRRLFSLVVSLGLIVLAGWVFFNRDILRDQLALASYNPPAKIEALAESADMTEQGAMRFYVNQPELHGKGDFNDVCKGIGNEQSNVLGCFTGDRIYIYDVPGQKLKGVEEVTAAHEMLHAAYSRLGGSEKESVNKLIKQQMKKYVAPHVQELISLYKNMEPDALMTEMHSILGTEQRRLIPELESYFGQYFNDRGTVLSLAAGYQKVFNTLKQKQKTLAAELNRLAQQIDGSTATLNQRVADYNAAVKQFNKQARSGQMTAWEFDSRKAELDAELDSINQAIDRNNALRDQYEGKRKQYESLIIQFTELQDQIDSSPAEPKSGV